MQDTRRPIDTASLLAECLLRRKMGESVPDWTREEAVAFAADLRAAGIVDVRVDGRDYVTPENTVGKRYRVVAQIVDARHGNMVLRRFDVLPGIGAGEIAQGMRREVTSRAKGTRCRIRAERDMDAE